MGGWSVNWLATADGASDWSRARVLVAGLGRSGFASADALREFGARVIVVDDGESAAIAERARLLDFLDIEVCTGAGASADLPADVDLVVTSPGWSPTRPLLAAALARGLPVWGEPELAWRLSCPDKRVPWLAVTGTNGKTTTTGMLHSILTAAGLRSAAVGNIGTPIIETVLDPEPYDVLAVELSSFQLHWSKSLQLHSAAVLNVHADHLQWYADWSDDPYAAYAGDKAQIYQRVTHSCVYNASDPVTERFVMDAEVTEGARAIGFTLAIPGMSMLGVVEDMLVDRAFVAQRRDSALPIAAVSDVSPPAPHNIANALAAAALARSYGVSPSAVSAGLRGYHSDGHRIAEVANHNQIRWIDDSKATNPHAANACLAAFDSVVWIAGGQAKGTTFDELVIAHRDRLRAVVLLGKDRTVIADALARHAPQIPVISIDSTDTGTMAQVVAAAAQLAQAGDVVLLSPGCASQDMYRDYAARGDAFATQVQSYLEG